MDLCKVFDCIKHGPLLARPADLLENMTCFCGCGNEVEDNEHFLLHCHQFHVMWQDLFERLSKIPGVNIDLQSWLKYLGQVTKLHYFSL